MKNRRGFLKKTAAGMFGTTFFPIQNLLSAPVYSAEEAVVKQLADCEIYMVRENTPITFLVTKATDKISAMSMCIEELPPGSAIPVHKHLHNDEYFFITSGTGMLMIDEKEFSFKPGTSVFIPKDTWHNFKNTGSEKVVFTFGFSPAGFENFFKEIGTPPGQPFKAKPPETIKVIAEKYGMVYRKA